MKKQKTRKKNNRKTSLKKVIVFFALIVMSVLFFVFANMNSVAFYDKKGNSLATFRVEIADTDIEREKGLMFVEELGRKKGMLFVYDEEQIVSMWMKNTLIPLDMIFIDANNTVQCIRKRTTPESLIPQICMNPVLYVLEVNGGMADKYGIKVGSKVEIKK